MQSTLQAMSMVWDFILSTRIIVGGFRQKIDTDPVIFFYDQSGFYLEKKIIERKQELKQEELLGDCYSHPIISNECLGVKMGRNNLIPDAFRVKLGKTGWCNVY